VSIRWAIFHRCIFIAHDDCDAPSFTSPHPRLSNCYQRTVSLHPYSFSFSFRHDFKGHVSYSPYAVHRTRLSGRLAAIRRAGVHLGARLGSKSGRLCQTRRYQSRSLRASSGSKAQPVCTEAVRAGHSQFAGGQGGEFGEWHCKLGHAVQIEPSLRSPSPKNGNNSNIWRRLSANSQGKRPNSEPGDRWRIRKIPPLAGISGIAGGKISRRGSAWLGRGGFEPSHGGVTARIPKELGSKQVNMSNYLAQN
jgi:hypothetical protein